MTKKTVFIAAAICLVLVSGPAVPNIVPGADKEVQAIADPILDNILDGFNKKSYARYSKDFSVELISQLSEETFLQTVEQIKTHLGDYQSRQYLGFLSRDDMTLVLWKGRFEKMDADVLIKLTLSQNGRKNEVEGLYFQ
jgi:hypothetical protein